MFGLLTCLKEVLAHATLFKPRPLLVTWAPVWLAAKLGSLDTQESLCARPLRCPEDSRILGTRCLFPSSEKRG